MSCLWHRPVGDAVTRRSERRRTTRHLQDFREPDNLGETDPALPIGSRRRRRRKVTSSQVVYEGHCVDS